MKESLEDFKKRIVGKSPKTYRVRNSLGVYDAYKYYRKNKPKDKKYILTESQYFSIIRQINLLMAEYLLNYGIIELPQRMGTLEVRKYDTKIKIGKDGKVYSNLPIDWDRTLKLWYDDEDSYKNKVLLRQEVDEIFKLYYNRARCNYNNHSYYEFSFNKDLRIRLKQQIKRGLIDAPYMGRNVKYGK